MLRDPGQKYRAFPPVELPDRRRAEYAYDPLGRRVEARFYDVPFAGRASVIERTRFVWDGDTIAHAIQVGIEYDPQPPFDGNAGRAPAHVMEILKPRYQRTDATSAAK